ncbi:hypothetical protein GDO86_002969 [Hymenochirus boettgeri]|uniref:Uncharacterized protein n=1 Tax=Hymenochirus boettgeri TaxID=247094 RepID=A0A8T2K3Z7_9PIPI|nr:hypothetical protein GDO86_002969 [Hymenochirus boettgeri]
MRGWLTREVPVTSLNVDMAQSGLLLRLNNREYKNWMKAGQCLLMLKDSIQDFIASEMSVFHQQLRARISTPTTKCRCKARGKQFQPDCPVCAEWKKHILDHHSNRNGEIHWGNCDPSLWATHYWEVAKAYMPRGNGDKKEPKLCDAAALLNLITACDQFKGPGQSKVREVIKCRNDLMHSSNMAVTSDWLKEFENKIQIFISEFRHVPGLKEEGNKIRQVLQSNWTVEELALDSLDGLALACDREIVSLFDLEMQLIGQMLQELYLQLEDLKGLSDEDLNCVQSVQNFLSNHEDLQTHFQPDMERLNLLIKQDGT